MFSLGVGVLYAPVEDTRGYNWKYPDFAPLTNSAEILDPKTCAQNFVKSIQAFGRYRGHTPTNISFRYPAVRRYRSLRERKSKTTRRTSQPASQSEVSISSQDVADTDL